MLDLSSRYPQCVGPEPKVPTDSKGVVDAINSPPVLNISEFGFIIRDYKNHNC